MQTARVRMRPMACLAWIVWLMIAPLTLGSIGSPQAAEDPFDGMAVQRLAQPGPAPELALPTLEGETIHLKDFDGKVVLLGFFTTA